MLKHYRENVGKWWRGFGQLRDIGYKPGWSWKWFLPMYALNYGSHVILWGGAVVSWSRFSYENRRRYKMARLVDSVLNFFDRGHGANAGPALWASAPIPSSEAAIVRGFWIVVTLAIALAVWG